MDYEFAQFGFADGEVAAEMGLPPHDGGWGVTFAVDERGDRHCFATDAAYLRLMLDIPPDTKPGEAGGRNMAILGFTDFPPQVFTLRKCGWPEDWSPEEEIAEWLPYDSA